MARAPIDDNHHKGLLAADATTGEAKALTSTDVSGDPALNVNILGGNITLNASDLQIGAMEIKNATDDTRLTIQTKGSVNVIPMALVDASGDQITSFGGGTQYTEGDADTTITGTALMWEDASDILRPVSVAKPLPVDIQDSTIAATLANVVTSTTSATLLASNSSRKKAVIINDSAAIMYVKYGTTASATSFSYLLQPYDTLEEMNYTGRIDGILASGTGAARTTEL